MTVAARRKDCRLCGSALDSPGLELGALPACNRFSAAAGPAQTHELAVTACGACGFVQLSVCPPAEFVVPRQPWIRYNEPEAHLDDAVEKLAGCIGSPGRAFGIGPFDSPLLDRLARSGWDCRPLNMLDGITAAPGTYPYLETIQAQLRPVRMQEIAADAGRADLIVCRYLLEHSHDPVASLAGLGALLNPGGQLVIEVPDSRKFLSRHDYSFVWEEHVCYFTEPTLRRLLAQAGCEVAALLRYEGLLEDLLLVVARPGGAAVATQRVPAEETVRFAAFAAGFSVARDAYRTRMGEIARAGGKIGIFGAGHQAIMFLNAFGLGPQIALLADDHPDKTGCYTPGMVAPIASSSVLNSDPALKICLLSTNPRIEDKIRSRLDQFLARGGRIYSIFAGIGKPTLIEPAT